MTTERRGLVMRASSGLRPHGPRTVRRLPTDPLEHRGARADAYGNMAPLPDPRSEPRPRPHLRAGLRPHLRAGIPALVAVAVMLVWAVQNGGFDASTWYWGALALLATF